MNKIRVLSDNLANQIAAGEVVERPASVVKELIENSLDAGATRIQADIELGGRRLIRISDDGEGMSRDDAVLAFERHATSKIATLEDLAAIGTLGFRGEALASIASVARVELLTKQDSGEVPTRVEVEGGRLVDVGDAARDRGTTISVRDLFFNTPARRKFMRSEATENFHLTNIIQHYALAHPEVAFRLTNNGREVLNLSPARELRERVFQIFGGGLMESLVPVAGGRDYVVKLNGFISAPRERRSNRDAQYFFVNGRYVRDKTITAGLREGFRSVLPHGVYPVAFLFLELPLEEVDVNVHPAKTEIRFRRTEAVKDAIAEAISSALSSAGIKPEVSETITPESQPSIEEAEAETAPSPVQDSFGDQVEDSDFTREQPQTFIDVAPVSEAPQQAIAAEQRFELTHTQPATGEVSPELLFEALVAGESVATASTPPDVASGNAVPLPPLNSASRYLRTVGESEGTLSGIRPIAQLRESFIIAIDSEGLLLIDQHVAHERILFDKFRRRETGRAAESQNLLLPETIDLTPAQADVFEHISGELELLGFGLMKLSGRTVAIKSIPTDVRASDARSLFAEMLNSVELSDRRRAKAPLSQDVAASLACKAAVKINMKLTPEKMQWMVDNLTLTDSPTTCPHGRPIILRLSLRDIERGFHRT
jgi:DNA mismatch repair protein MutL